MDFAVQGTKFSCPDCLTMVMIEVAYAIQGELSLAGTCPKCGELCHFSVAKVIAHIHSGTIIAPDKKEQQH